MNDRELLYVAAFWQALFGFGILSLIAGGLLTLFSAAKGRGAAAISTVFTLLVVLIGSPIVGYTNANAAVGPNWEQAIDDKATYLEKLHGVWVRYDVVHHTCQYRDNDLNINDTGCTYITVDSYCDSYDDEGDCDDTDYRFYPWFRYEETLTGELNIFKRGHVVFARHLAPEDWRSHEWYKPMFADPGTDFHFQRPYEWLRVKQAVDSATLLPGTVYNPYFHWIFADDHTILKEYSPHIGRYRELGLLPTINMIHDSGGHQITSDIRGNLNRVGFDYDVVQFLGVDVGSETAAEWQWTAHLWAAMAGPEIESSLMLFFAPASKVEYPNQWVKTSKAWLMTEVTTEDGEGFGRYVLPKNVVLIGCGVSDDNRTVEWCEAETGLFLGNRQFIRDVQDLQPFPFTPTRTFGVHDGRFVTEQGRYVMHNPDWDDRNTSLHVVELDFVGGSINQVVRDSREGHGFHRVEMADFVEKRATLKLNEEEIAEIRSSSLFNALMYAVVLWGAVYLLLAIAASKSR